MTIREVAEKILQQCPAMEDESQTVDTFKHGDPERPCTGVVTTINATVEVIKKTAELGCNLIITHEPTWWNHRDDTGWLGDDAVYAAKAKLLDDAGIAVWRFHDHMHMHQPDLIFSGVTAELGWQDYSIPQALHSPYTDEHHFLCAMWQLPALKFTDVAALFKQKLGLEGIHYVGNPGALIRRAAICIHEFEFEPQQQFVRIMKEREIDLLIPGESVNWATQAYVKDAAALGENKAMLLIGHFNMEALGMKNMAEAWLPGVLGGGAPCHFVSAGDSYRYL